MEKWCDYAISNIRKNNDEITFVYLQEDKGDYFEPLGIKSERQVIEMIDRGLKIITVVWGYPSWHQGAEVRVVEGQNQRYLRTIKDETAEDNLLNLPRILK